jgi:uncharacterized coiled-coil protein SlyX
MIGILLANWRLVVMAALLAAVGIQTARLHWCQNSQAGLEARITVLNANIAEQNRAVDALKAASAAKQAASERALRRAEDRARVWDAQAKRLANALANRPKDAGCTEAWSAIRSVQ